MILLMCEIGHLCVVMPPFLDQEAVVRWPTGAESRMTWQDLLTFVVFLRLYHVMRFIYSQSRFFLPNAQFYSYCPHSHLHGIYNSPKFILLAQMNKRPFSTIMAVSAFIMLFSGLLFHMVERSANSDLVVYDGPYFIAITQLTVGFGDITPKTDLGRLLTMGPGLCAMLTLSLVMAYTLKFIEMTREEKKLAKDLSHKAAIRSKLSDLAATFLQRWWRLQLSRGKPADPLRLKRLLDCKCIHHQFQRRFATDLKGLTPELEAQLNTFKRSVDRAFSSTRLQLLRLPRCSSKAGYFSTDKFNTLAKVLFIKHKYLRCKVIGSTQTCVRQVRSVTYVRKKQKRSSIGEKRASDMAVKKMKVRLSQMPSADNLDAVDIWRRGRRGSSEK